MINLIFRLLITVAALKTADLVLPGFSVHGSFWRLVWFGVILGLLNWFVKPILVFFSIPFIILTIGFFYMVINALILYATSYLMPGVISSTTPGLFLGSLFISVFHWIYTALIRGREKHN